MDTTRLTNTAFRATFVTGMREVTSRVTPEHHEALHLWTYVDAIPADDLGGLQLQARDVRQVWRDAYDRWDHVLLPLTRHGTYLVVVVDVRNACIYGHHVLDLGSSEPRS